MKTKLRLGLTKEQLNNSAEYCEGYFDGIKESIDVIRKFEPLKNFIHRDRLIKKLEGEEK